MRAVLLLLLGGGMWGPLLQGEQQQPRGISFFALGAPHHEQLDVLVLVKEAM